MDSTTGEWKKLLHITFPFIYHSSLCRTKLLETFLFFGDFLALCRRPVDLSVVFYFSLNFFFVFLFFFLRLRSALLISNQ